MIKKSRLINLRIEDQLLDEIEKIAIEKFNENTSQAIRYLVNLGVKFELIPKNELDKEKIEEITNEMNQKMKNESIFPWLDSLQPSQQKAVKNWIDLKEE
jgi:antitoxin component of RelBE/YafQ-DinJ toxin-antitoxin module